MKCLVKCCNHGDHRANPQISFHRIPIKKTMRNVWLKILGVSEVSARSRVCSLHFNESDYEVVLTRHLLKKGAVPSQNLEEKINEIVLIEEVPMDNFLIKKNTQQQNYEENIDDDIAIIEEVPMDNSLNKKNKQQKNYEENIDDDVVLIEDVRPEINDTEAATVDEMKFEFCFYASSNESNCSDLRSFENEENMKTALNQKAEPSQMYSDFSSGHENFPTRKMTLKTAMTINAKTSATQPMETIKKYNAMVTTLRNSVKKYKHSVKILNQNLRRKSSKIAKLETIIGDLKTQIELLKKT